MPTSFYSEKSTYESCSQKTALPWFFSLHPTAFRLTFFIPAVYSSRAGNGIELI